MKKKLLVSTLLFLFSLAANAQSGFSYSGNVTSSNLTVRGTGHAHTPNWGYQAMPPHRFSAAKQAILSQRFDNARLDVARQIVRDNILLSAQIKEIMYCLRFESSRIEFAKTAYASAVDPQNYFIVNEAFRFSSSVADLDRFIRRNAAPSGVCGHGIGCTMTACGAPAQGPAVGHMCSNACSSPCAFVGQNSGDVGVYHGGNGQAGYGYGHPAPAPVEVIEPMCGRTFGALMAAVERQPFSDDKLRIAKQGTRDRFITSEQARQMTSIFTFESTKLKFAKFAYDRTIDPENYFVVNDAFTFSSSIRELDEFIWGR